MSTLKYIATKARHLTVYEQKMTDILTDISLKFLSESRHKSINSSHVASVILSSPGWTYSPTFCF